jgi:hypothetical protein
MQKEPKLVVKMKSFQQYLSEREQASPTDSMGIGLGSIETPSSDDALMGIAKIAVDDHRTDVLSFFQHLAAKDGRIEEELKDYHSARKHGERPKSKGPHDFPDDNRDEVVPSSADSTGGAEGGGDGG